MSDDIPGNGAVQILLGGLMVIRYNRAEKTFELGILDEEDHGHRFSICYEIRGPQEDSAKQVKLTERGGLSLEIEGKESDAKPFILEGRPNRLVEPGNETARHKDSRWMLDLEDKSDFPRHPDPPMPLKFGQFQRVITIKNGTLYNLIMSRVRFRRILHGGTPENFGFVSDIMAVDLPVRSGEPVVLTNTKTRKELFRISLEHPHPLVEKASIYITNLPPDDQKRGADQESHFPMYYHVFNVDQTQRYDFDKMPEHSQSLSDQDSSVDSDDGIQTSAVSDDEAHAHSEGHEPEDGDAHATTPSPIEPPACSTAIGNPGFLCGPVSLGQSKTPMG